MITEQNLHDNSKLALQIRLNDNLPREQQVAVVITEKEPSENNDFSSTSKRSILVRPGQLVVSAHQEENKGSQPASLAAPSPPPITSDANRLSEYRLVGLDPPPRPLHDIDPTYPLEAGSREGTVAMRLLINEKGTVDNVAVISSYPKEMFDDSAIQAFKSARFSPGLFLGMPVKSQLIVEVEFMPINRGASISGRGY
jgi:TonB family protein